MYRTGNILASSKSRNREALRCVFLNRCSTLRWNGHLRLCMRRRFARGHGERIKLRWRVDPLRTVEQTFNCQNLETRIILIVPKLGCITAGVARFFARRFARFVKSDQNSARRFLIFHIAEQCRDITTIYPAAFDLNNYFLAVDWIVADGRRLRDAFGEEIES